MIGDLRDQLRVFEGRQAGDQIVKLKHESDVLSAKLGQFLARRRRQIVIFVVDFAAGGYIQPSKNIQKGGFSATGRPQEHHEFARKKVQSYPAQRMNFDVSHAVDLGDFVHVEDGIRCRPAGSPAHEGTIHQAFSGVL